MNPSRIAEAAKRLSGGQAKGGLREWLDLPVPALGHQTPRHAARLKTIRPKLEQLLKEIENRSERERLNGGPGYDIGWLRKELGML